MKVHTYSYDQSIMGLILKKGGYPLLISDGVRLVRCKQYGSVFFDPIITDFIPKFSTKIFKDSLKFLVYS